MKTCPLCHQQDEDVVFSGSRYRVIRVHDKNYPGYFRVIVKDHYAELSDLPPELFYELMQAVVTVEAIVRDYLKPTKINIASLGNQVPHLHWHIIARFENDAHFPESIWAKPNKEVSEQQLNIWKEQVDKMVGKMSFALFKLSVQ